MLGRSLLPLALVAVFALAGCGSDSDEDRAGVETTTATERPSASTERLVERLRHGGFVLAFRHAATDLTSTDMTGDPLDCARQRNLNRKGRRESREIGRSFRELGIPVGRVLASPFCRTRDTARLAFGRVQPSRALLSAEFLAGEAAAARQRNKFRELLAQRPSGETNTVLVSHNFAIDDATGVSLAEGEAVILVPGRGPRGFDVAGRIEAGEWPRLAAG